jgi:hypothetical protein
MLFEHHCPSDRHEINAIPCIENTGNDSVQAKRSIFVAQSAVVHEFILIVLSINATATIALSPLRPLAHLFSHPHLTKKHARPLAPSWRCYGSLPQQNNENCHETVTVYPLEICFF